MITKQQMEVGLASLIDELDVACDGLDDDQRVETVKDLMRDQGFDFTDLAQVARGYVVDNEEFLEIFDGNVVAWATSIATRFYALGVRNARSESMPALDVAA